MTNSAKWVSKKLKYGLVISPVFWLIWAWLPWWDASHQSPSSIVVLGGGIRREILAAQLAQSHPNLPIIVSSGSSLPCLYRVFVEENKVDWRRLKVDFRATDTLTNFTALLPYLQSNQTRKVFMITSKGNLPRASIMAWLIWGSRGIAMEPILVEGVGNNESWLKTLADGTRALAWIVLGEKTVANSYSSGTEIQSQTNLRHSTCEVGSATLPASI